LSFVKFSCIYLRKKHQTISLKQNDKILIVTGLVAGIVGLAVMIGFIGQGNVRHVEIFWAEKVEQIVVFQDIDGETKIQAIKESKEITIQH